MTATPSDPTVVTLIPGDGIGPECVDAARRIIEAAGVPIAWEECEAGAEVFKKGLPSGVPPETIESISRTRVALKGPLEPPVGFGEKSANVTLRKLFETYANVRPVREIDSIVSGGTPDGRPFLKTSAPASHSSQVIGTPAASMMRRAAATHSGPIPSPGMSVTTVGSDGVAVT